MSEAVDGLKVRLRTDLKAAMKARETLATSVIRSLIAAIDNAQAVPVDLSGPATEQRQFGEAGAEVSRRDLSLDALHCLLRREADARIAAAEDMARFGQAEKVDQLRVEAQIILSYFGA